MALFDFLGQPTGLGQYTWGQVAGAATQPQAPTLWMPPPQMGAQFMPPVPGVSQLPGSPLPPMGGEGASTGQALGAVQDLSKLLGGAGTAGAATGAGEAAAAGAAEAGAGAGTAAAGLEAAGGASIWSQIGSWLLALL